MMADSVKKGSNIVSLYGNVAIERGYCRSCKASAFVFEGRLACCNAEHSGSPERYRREIEAEQTRRSLGLGERREVLALQEDACIYCGVGFGRHVLRRGRAVRLQVHWDHFVPFSFAQNNYAYNFVASCQVCNLIKGSLCFQDLEEARLYIMAQREKKGII